MNLKHTKKRMVVLFGTTLLGLGLTACGGGSSSSDVSLTPPPAESEKVTIDASNQDEVIAAAVQAIGASKINVPMFKSSSSSSISPSGRQPIYKKILSATPTLKTLAASGSAACPDGGSISTSGTQTSGSATYNNCQIQDVIINGSVKFTDNGQSGSIAYTNFTMSGQDDMNMAFDSLTYTYQMDSNYEITSMSMAINGAVTYYNQTNYYNNYKFNLNTDNNGNTIYALNGFIKTPCLDAWIEVTTMQDVIITSSGNCPTSGEISIGGNNSSMTVTFNPNSSVDVSINGNAPQTYDSCENLDTGICSL